MLFAAVYLGFSFNENTLMVFVLFGLYGIYAGATEGIAKAWISNLAPATKTATALGLLGSLQSMATLAASTLAGWIWETNGSKTVFLLAAVLALLTIPLLLSIEAAKKEASAE
jgi:MFS family permease